MIMKNYVADELSNKVYHLHTALTKASEIIAVLEAENTRLKAAIDSMVSAQNKENRVLDSEAWFGSAATN